MLDNSTYIILTLNNNIYYIRCVSTDVITCCTLIVPCLIPVYVSFYKQVYSQQYPGFDSDSLSPLMCMTELMV